MNPSAGTTRRAACAAFLLFAAVLLVVAPAEASLPRSAGVDPVDAAALASLERPALGLASPTLAPSGFSLGEDLSVFDATNAQGSLGLCGLEARRCAITYARNNPLKYVDPDGKEWRLAPGADAEAVENALSEFIRHPSGYRDFLEIAESESTNVVLRTASLNPDLDKADFELRAGGEPTIRFAETTPPVEGTFRMTLDFAAISRFGTRTEKGGEQAASGATTVGHETQHVKAGVKGGHAAMKAGDVRSSATGTAQKEATRILREKPTRTKEEAMEVVKKYLLPCKSGVWGCQ